LINYHSNKNKLLILLSAKQARTEAEQLQKKNVPMSISIKVISIFLLPRLMMKMMIASISISLVSIAGIHSNKSAINGVISLLLDILHSCVLDGKHGLHIWREVAKILNKQLAPSDKCCFS
jgi:hypothetical protein